MLLTFFTELLTAFHICPLTFSENRMLKKGLELLIYVWYATLEGHADHVNIAWHQPPGQARCPPRRFWGGGGCVSETNYLLLGESMGLVSP